MSTQLSKSLVKAGSFLKWIREGEIDEYMEDGLNKIKSNHSHFIRIARNSFNLYNLGKNSNKPIARTTHASLSSRSCNSSSNPRTPVRGISTPNGRGISSGRSDHQSPSSGSSRFPATSPVSVRNNIPRSPVPPSIRRVSSALSELSELTESIPTNRNSLNVSPATGTILTFLSRPNCFLHVEDLMVSPPGMLMNLLILKGTDF